MPLWFNGRDDARVKEAERRPRHSWFGPFSDIEDVKRWMRANGFKEQADKLESK